MNIIRRINWIDSTTLKACILGKLGFSNKKIIRETNLTQSQLTYRLHRAGIRRIDYRDGTSHTAKVVVSNVTNLIADKTKRENSRLLNKGNHNGSQHQEVGSSKD